MVEITLELNENTIIKQLLQILLKRKIVYSKDNSIKLSILEIISKNNKVSCKDFQFDIIEYFLPETQINTNEIFTLCMKKIETYDDVYKFISKYMNLRGNTKIIQEFSKVIYEYNGNNSTCSKCAINLSCLLFASAYAKSLKNRNQNNYIHYTAPMNLPFFLFYNIDRKYKPTKNISTFHKYCHEIQEIVCSTDHVLESFIEIFKNLSDKYILKFIKSKQKNQKKSKKIDQFISDFSAHINRTNQKIYEMSEIRLTCILFIAFNFEMSKLSSKKTNNANYNQSQVYTAYNTLFNCIGFDIKLFQRSHTQDNDPILIISSENYNRDKHFDILSSSSQDQSCHQSSIAAHKKQNFLKKKKKKKKNYSNSNKVVVPEQCSLLIENDQSKVSKRQRIH